jgi:2-amino-4-hydroxy-6-hydroxymethyldihydropteridine diphosphokinase
VARVYFSIGSNQDPARHIGLAVREIEDRFGQVDISPVYRNKAIGFDGEDFLNLVVGLDTDKSVIDVCHEIGAIHELAQRSLEKRKFVSRTLDIDLLLYAQLVTAGPPMKLPRVDVLKYAFALKPLADIAPDECHPETGMTFAEHWKDMDPSTHPLTVVQIDFTSRDSGRRQPL